MTSDQLQDLATDYAAQYVNGNRTHVIDLINMLPTHQATVVTAAVVSELRREKQLEFVRIAGQISEKPMDEPDPGYSSGHNDYNRE